MAALTEPPESANLHHAPIAPAWHERVESLKAGVVGALGAAIAAGAIMLINQQWLWQTVTLPAWNPLDTVWQWVISGGIAALSGFLFGVTYRYIIRCDRNPHLNAGAVLAFGCVRGLTQIDVGLHMDSAWLPLLITLSESLVLFAATRLLLDLSLAQRWLKPFPAAAAGRSPLSSAKLDPSSRIL
jgi:hypothetical protein